MSHFVPHWLLEQTGVARGLVGQTLSQAPQFSTSVLMLAQALPHLMYGEAQLKPHVPAAHVGVALSGGMHTLVQSPQCDVLV